MPCPCSSVQYGADCQSGTIIVPFAFSYSFCRMHFRISLGSGPTQLTSPGQFWSKLFKASVPGTPNLELNLLSFELYIEAKRYIVYGSHFQTSSEKNPYIPDDITSPRPAQIICLLIFISWYPFWAHDYIVLFTYLNYVPSNTLQVLFSSTYLPYKLYFYTIRENLVFCFAKL